MDGRITRRRLIVGGLAVAASPLLASTASAAPYPVSVPVLPWPAANDIVARTKRPVFPDRTYSVLDFGAKGDGKTDNTAAIEKAIHTANARGGGHVVVPKGTFVTGTVLKFGSDASKFPNVLTRYEGIECVNRSPMIYAYKESNGAVTGPGTLDAIDTASWNKGKDREYLETLVAKGIPPEKRIVPGSGHAMRSAFVEPYACDTVLIQGVTLKNPRSNPAATPTVAGSPCRVRTSSSRTV
jgi:polygalacturonase